MEWIEQRQTRQDTEILRHARDILVQARDSRVKGGD